MSTQPMPFRMPGRLALCGVIAWFGLHWPDYLYDPPAGGSTPAVHHPVVAESGSGVPAWANDHGRAPDQHATSVALEQAQILLCVFGALMTIVIRDSLARAFGIAGAARLIGFRTPVEDPIDTIILFLSLGLGMAAPSHESSASPLFSYS